MILIFGGFKVKCFLVTSSEESESEQENVTRRPGERGKSAIKEIQDDGEDDAYSPIEGYEFTDSQTGQFRARNLNLRSNKYLGTD